MQGTNTPVRDEHAAQEPVRVALFTGAYNHIADGVSLTLNRLVAYLERQGYEVLVFAPTVDEPPIEHAGTLVPVPSLPAPGRPEYRLSLRLSSEARARLKAFRPAIVHIATPDLLGLAALRWARKQGVPVVASYHTHFSSYLKYYGLQRLEGLLWRYLRWFYRQCRQIYVPTPSMEAVLRQHGIDGGLHLWPRGVELGRFSPSKRSLAWRRDLGIADDEPVVAFVSRLVWEKGLDVYADVVERLRARGVRHRSLVVGDGPALEGLRARLPETLFTGHLGGDELATAYASSDVFLFPSDTETFGNVTLEAMASGLPAVCADATGSNALVLDGQTGFLVEPGASDAFFERVEQLVSDGGLRGRMGEAARRHARSYDWEAVLARIPACYDALLGRAPARTDREPAREPAEARNVSARWTSATPLLHST